MVWQPTMHVWAGDTVKIDERELEEPMEGIESTADAEDDAGPSGEGGSDISKRVDGES